MLTKKIENHLQTSSGNIQQKVASGAVFGYLSIKSYGGVPINPDISLNQVKFSFNIVSGSENIARIDNDHPIDVSGSQFFGLHQHEFISGSTAKRTPIHQVKNVGEAGSLARKLWENIF